MKEIILNVVKNALTAEGRDEVLDLINSSDLDSSKKYNARFVLGTRGTESFDSLTPFQIETMCKPRTQWDYEFYVAEVKD